MAHRLTAAFRHSRQLCVGAAVVFPPAAAKYATVFLQIGNPIGNPIENQLCWRFLQVC